MCAPGCALLQGRQGMLRAGRMCWQCDAHVPVLQDTLPLPCTWPVSAQTCPDAPSSPPVAKSRVQRLARAGLERSSCL